MTCLELLSVSTRNSDAQRERRASQADPTRYLYLHPEGRRLISGWFGRAWDMQQLPSEEHFEAFIFSWIAFNGWAACITGVDVDREWLDALMLSQQIQQAFAQLVSNPDTATRRIAQEFYHFWPVFKAQAIRRQGVYVEDQNRRTVVDHYFRAGIDKFEPQCWQRHRQEGSAVPVDWPHTLAVLYRVRCNLFHGDKAVHSEMDRSIVSLAFQTLVTFMREASYL